MPSEKHPKAKSVESLRHAEYYDMQRTFDELYTRSQAREAFDNLMELILSKDNIMLAYRNIKSNPGSATPGTDRLRITDIGRLPADEVVARVRKIVRGGTNGYTPRSVRRKEIPKPNGKTRPLGIPCIWDRLIQQCIKQVMEPICEAKFSSNSYGFRPNRSVENAIAAIYRLMQRSGLYYVCAYTPQGRSEIHNDLQMDTTLLLQLMKATAYSRSAEYMDNRISLFSAQQGKCAVTGKTFESVSDIHCHHKRPKSLGGTDCYGNLVLVLAPVHELIHATNKSAIDSRLSVLKLNRQQLAKLNRLRISAEVKPIDSEEIALELNSHNGMTKEIKKTV